MARASVKLTCTKCGREFKHESVCYNREEANKYEDWARNNILFCPRCYGAEARAAKAERRAKEREAQLKAAAAEAERLSLPTLTGTEKQVAQANLIRHEMIAKYGLGKGLPKGFTVDRLKAILNDAMEDRYDVRWVAAAVGVYSEARAKWFIDDQHFFLEM